VFRVKVDALSVGEKDHGMVIQISPPVLTVIHDLESGRPDWGGTVLFLIGLEHLDF